jgi:hypothetical protein
MEHGMEVNRIASDGSTALELATSGGHFRTVRLLLQHGEHVFSLLLLLLLLLLSTACDAPLLIMPFLLQGHQSGSAEHCKLQSSRATRKSLAFCSAHGKRRQSYCIESKSCHGGQRGHFAASACFGGSSRSLPRSFGGLFTHYQRVL